MAEDHPGRGDGTPREVARAAPGTSGDGPSGRHAGTRAPPGQPPSKPIAPRPARPLPAKPVATKPVATKPAVGKPVVIKPAVGKPVAGKLAPTVRLPRATMPPLLVRSAGASRPVAPAGRQLTAAPPPAEAADAPDAADEFGWDDVLLLPRADVRSRSRLGAAVSRSLLWGNGRRNIGVASLLACCALTAACGSATRLARPDAPATAFAAARPAETSSPVPAPALTPGLRAAGRARYANRIEPDAPAAPAVEAAAGLRPEIEPVQPEERAPAPREPDPSGAGRSITRLVAFRSAPFPYEGVTGDGTPFINVVQGEQRGHRGHRGQVLWADRTFSDNRALVHVPAHFDPSQPGALVVFFHGYGATLSRDVGARQQVPQQVEASGANVAMVAPQFASDARDPSAGHFWEPGGCARFLAEAAHQVGEMRGVAAGEIARMPLVLVAYSGGFCTAALCLKDPAVARRTRTVLMLDAAYGDLETYADWAASRPGNAFVSGYTHFTARQNGELRSLLAARGVAIQLRLGDALARGGAAFLPADSSHNDYVTQAWTENPVGDLLARMPGLNGRDPQAIAAVDMMPTGSIR